MIRDGVAKVLKRFLNVEEIPFNVPPHRKTVDFSSAICLSLAKERRRSPMEIAQKTAEQLKINLPPFIKEVTVSARISELRGRLAEIGSRTHPSNF